MSSIYGHLDILYTVRAEEREGLFAALDHLDPETFEVVLDPTSDLNKCTIRTETVEGAVAAVNDIAPKWRSAIIRVYEPEGDA